MELGEDLDKRAQLQLAYAEARVTAVQSLSRALAHAAGDATPKNGRSSKLDLTSQKQRTEPAAAASRSKALSIMKVAVKHKPKLIKFTGAVTVPMDAERVAPPDDAPLPSPGWSLVWYRDGPAPVGKPMKMMKTYRTSGRRRPMAGLSAAYKQPVQAELVPCSEELEEWDAVSEDDARRMEQWLLHARERLEAIQQQQQQQQQGTVPKAVQPPHS